MIEFSKISQSSYIPLVESGIKSLNIDIERILSNDILTFDNTIVALEESGRDLSFITNIIFNLHSCNTNDELDEIVEHISPMLSDVYSNINLNSELFRRVKYIYDTCDRSVLDNEDIRLLENIYDGFILGGALLSNDDKNRVKTLTESLSLLSIKFNKNLLSDINDYYLHILDESGLDGLPDSAILNAKLDAETMGLDGWIITLKSTSITPFTKYSTNRLLRRTILDAYSKICYNDNDNNNIAIINEIIDTKSELANILGFETYSDYILSRRMAKSKDVVIDFLNDLLVKTKPYAISDLSKIKEYAKDVDGIDDFDQYDQSYYINKMIESIYLIDTDKIRDYFELDNVLNAAFDIANELYGLSFSKVGNADAYSDDVSVYEVTEDGNIKSFLYTDFFTRDNKGSGAWMTSFRDQCVYEGVNVIPLISIVCNFTRPINGKPSLLTFDEVLTLFHEFGHALHGMLSNVKYASMSGTNVYWDFVELPSQFMENFCYEEMYLKKFAKHYLSGELLDNDTINNLIDMSNFMESIYALRQIGLGLLDISYFNGLYKPGKEHIEDFENRITSESRLYNNKPGSLLSSSFSHIFGGGYSSGYYSYKWAEILDADAFQYLKENKFNTDISKKFKTLMSKGGTVDPMELYIEFRGCEPDNKAYLLRSGLFKSI